MSVSAANIHRLDANRFLFLVTLYKMCESDETQIYPINAIGNALGFDDGTTRLIVQWLLGEQYIKIDSGPMVADGNPNPGQLVQITHKGVLTAESALLDPNRPAGFFPPAYSVNVPQVSIQTMIGSQFQMNSPGGFQSLSLTEGRVDELKTIIGMLAPLLNDNDLTSQQQKRLASSVETLRKEAKSAGALLKITAALSTAKIVLEDVVGIKSSVSDILEKITKWMDANG